MSENIAKLVFDKEFTERDAYEAQVRGYLSHVMVELNGVRYPVYFYDIVRLQQDLEEDAQHYPLIAEPGMIVLPELTLSSMEYAIQKLAEEGFFSFLVPINK